jgi:triosephosphate isomerase
MKNMLIAGNWKMNTNVFESQKLVEYILGFLSSYKDLKSKVLVCPPFTSLFTIGKMIDNTKLLLGAQNCYYEEKGAFTGEISIPMLEYCGVRYVIIGHSERRAYFNETDELINKKLLALLQHNLTPILCIGETLDERNRGETFQVLKNQLEQDLAEAPFTSINKIVIAYEPVWAIGTGVSASREQVVEAHDFLRSYLIEKYGENAKNVYLLYGGSLSEKNADEILSIENVNGGLIGGASLKGESFTEIIKIAEKYL